MSYRRAFSRIIAVAGCAGILAAAALRGPAAQAVSNHH